MDKLQIVKEARAQIVGGTFQVEQGQWLGWKWVARGSLHPGDKCTGCAAGALIYGWLCRDGEATVLHEPSIIDVVLLLAPHGFMREEILLIDKTFENRGSPDGVLYSLKAGVTEEGYLAGARALCWLWYEKPTYAPEERALAILDRMIEGGGTFVPPPYTPKEMIEMIESAQKLLRSKEG